MKTALSQVLAICFLLGLSACADGGSNQPKPEAAKRFLKLRGYNFDEESFLSAAVASDPVAVNWFLSAGINVNARGTDGHTALTAASAAGDTKVVSALLGGGADVNAKGINDWTAFLLALQGERDAVAELLFAQPNLEVNAATPAGTTALMFAVTRRREPMVQKLLERGANVNHQDKEGDTALNTAALRADVSILEMLFAKGANPNLRNKLGGTALMWAAAYGHDEVVRLLLNKGADPRIKDIDGVTAGGWAKKNGRDELAKLLSEAEKKK